MKNAILLGLVACVAVSCRVAKPRGPMLSPTGGAAFFVAPSVPMITLYWTNEPMSALVINVRQSPDPFSDPTNWATIANATGTKAITIPMLPARSYFAASVVAQTLTLAWDYPADQLSPDLSFNLYWQPDGATEWTFFTNVPPDGLMAQLQVTVPSGRFAMTATNSTLQAESDFSNIVSWTTSVGQPVQLNIALP